LNTSKSLPANNYRINCLKFNLNLCHVYPKTNHSIYVVSFLAAEARKVDSEIHIHCISHPDTE